VHLDVLDVLDVFHSFCVVFPQVMQNLESGEAAFDDLNGKCVSMCVALNTV
jgi:hypothetical protein